MRKTTILEKLIPSTINSVLSILIALPFLGKMPLGYWKILVIGIFFAYNGIILLFNQNRCLGMIYHRTRWSKKARFMQEFIYTILYTASFATLFIWVWFPFDLFIFNILILQLPCILMTGTTFHAYVSGKGSTYTSRHL